MTGWGTPDWEETHWIYHFLKGTFHHPLKWGLRIRAKGWERFPRDGPVVVVSNHYSWADPVILEAVIGRPGYFLAKHTLFRKGVLGWMLRSLDMVPVDREKGGNEAAVDAGVRYLERGRVVGVYPEGTRSVFPQLLPFRTGAVRMAVRTGAPVVPVGCLTDRLWGKGRALPRPWHSPYVAIGEPYRLGHDPSLAQDRDFCRKASDDLQRRVESLLAQCALAREKGEAWRYP